MAIVANNIASPTINGIQNLAKKVILEISKFAFNQHYNATSIYPSRTYQTAFTAKHTLIHLLVSSLILPSAHQSMHLAEVKVRQVTSRAGGCAGTATDAGLQLGHLAQNLVALAQVVAIDVDRAGFIY
jgi:hypothetical protein